MGNVTGKQRDREISRLDMEIHDDTLLVAGKHHIHGGFVERYNLNFDNR